MRKDAAALSQTTWTAGKPVAAMVSMAGLRLGVCFTDEQGGGLLWAHGSRLQIARGDYSVLGPIMFVTYLQGIASHKLQTLVDAAESLAPE